MKNIDEMSMAAVDVLPVDYDFGNGYGDVWDVIYPSVDDVGLEEMYDVMHRNDFDIPYPDIFSMELEELKEFVKRFEFSGDLGELRRLVMIAYGDKDGDIYEEFSSWREIYRDALENDPDSYVPMMNYYYPLPNYRGDPSKDQWLLSDLSVVLVEVDGDVVMALAGGGMDLSEDICLGYMRLGYLPPFYFANVDSFYHRSGSRKLLLEACKASAEVIRRCAEVKLSRINEALGRFS